jgi:hypothetical protein
MNGGKQNILPFFLQTVKFLELTKTDRKEIIKDVWTISETRTDPKT